MSRTDRVHTTSLSSPEEIAASHMIDAAWSHVSHDAKMRLAKFQRKHAFVKGSCSLWTEDLVWAWTDDEWAQALMITKLEGKG